MTQSAVLKVQNFLKSWDGGSALARAGILKDFIARNKGRTGPEIDEEFCQASSLFLNRISAWLRLSYITGTYVSLQLKALNTFLAATAGYQFMAQFIEIGGVCTLLEIVALKQSENINRTLSLKILANIASAGRQYKELICECYGIRTIAECLAKSKCEETQENCKIVMQLLSQGNPKYEMQVYKSFIALLPCTSPKAQQLALQNLRSSQKIVREANPSLVEPLIALLSSVHFEVQYEAIEFIRELLVYDVRDSLIEGLVRALRPTREDLIVEPQQQNLLVSLEKTGGMKGALPAYVKQSAAAKTIGILCKDSSVVAEAFLKLDVVRNLIFACGNTEYYHSQRESSLTLEYLALTFNSINELVKEAMGDEVYNMFINDAEYFYTKLKAVQVDVLVHNKVVSRNPLQ